EHCRGQGDSGHTVGPRPRGSGVVEWYARNLITMGRLEHKVVWISGATSGIGEATARLFAREGAKVALAGRRLALSRRIAGELKGQGGEALPVACDVSKEAQVRDSIRKTVERFGRLDIIVNN